jgi:hypothetical protein
MFDIIPRTSPPRVFTNRAAVPMADDVMRKFCSVFRVGQKSSQRLLCAAFLAFRSFIDFDSHIRLRLTNIRRLFFLGLFHYHMLVELIKFVFYGGLSANAPEYERQWNFTRRVEN